MDTTVKPLTDAQRARLTAKADAALAAARAALDALYQDDRAKDWARTGPQSERMRGVSRVLDGVETAQARMGDL